MNTYIAIDGRSGSGKTHLSHVLAQELSAAVLHLDDFGDDYHPFIGVPKLVSALKEIHEPLIIFEGVGVLCDSFDEFDAYKILVSVPEAVRQRRIRQRDIPTATRSAEEWQKIFSTWDAAEEAYFKHLSRDTVNLVVGEQDGVFNVPEIVAQITRSIV